MQLMGDALAVLGSRLGFAWDPVNYSAYLMRYGMHPGMPLKINAGIRIDNREVVLPLTPEKEYFDFHDQDMTPTTMQMSGIDPDTGLKVKLTTRVPFRPRDPKFSTIPAVFIELSVERLSNNFRWINQQEGDVQGQIFLEFAGEEFTLENVDDGFTISYETEVIQPGPARGFEYDRPLKCKDRLSVIDGELVGNEIVADFSLGQGVSGPKIATAWCSHDRPVFWVLRGMAKLKYTEWFDSIEEVEKWARENYQVVVDNSRKVDSLLAAANIGESVNHLLAQTLHSWLINTWWGVKSDGQDWFTVWEGSCYYHSTIDVEYTQAPFYLILWPELLELELNQWPEFAKDGSFILGGEREETLFLSHDLGKFAWCNRQHYSHEMEIEENTNYLLMLFAHWRRTGIDKVMVKQKTLIPKLMNFIIGCDTSGNGIPDICGANTIDDASPALQFGSEQVYLGVKSLAACFAGIKMLEYLAEDNLEQYQEFVAQGHKTIEEKGWLGDHYAVTLTKTKDGLICPWTGEEMKDYLEGWDAYHIYTANGLALLDMVGVSSLLDNNKLKQDAQNALTKTIGKYGCRHTSYIANQENNEIQLESATSKEKLGWISMNMLRDITAAYRGLDLFYMADKYWDWQSTVNTQQCTCFFETFYGNNLHFYPRGVAVFGYLDAILGFTYDAITDEKTFAPVRSGLQVPLLSFADWHNGTAPIVKTELIDGKIECKVERQ